MKFVAALLIASAGSASAFSNFGKKAAAAPVAPTERVIDTLVGALDPVGFFDPLGFAEKADDNTLRRYREAELTHGRVASKFLLLWLKIRSEQIHDIKWNKYMTSNGTNSHQQIILFSSILRITVLAAVGFLAGEAVEGSSFLFDASVSGPAITHLSQVPVPFWLALVIGIGASEQKRATIGWVEPENVPVDQPGLLRDGYLPGDIGFDPLNLKPEDEEEFRLMQTKELQNGRVAMIATAGFMAQELVDGKGILEHFA
jgi:hypothetical protein